MAIVDLLSHDEALTAVQNDQCVFTPAEDDALSQMVTAVTVLIEQKAGPVVQRTQVDTLNGGDGCSSSLRLRSRPVSVTTVVEGTTTLTATDYLLDARAELLYRRVGSTDSEWYWGRENVVVTYKRGRVTETGVAITTVELVPATFKVAAQITLKHLWSSMKGFGSATFGNGEGYSGPAPWAIPKMALMVLTGELLLPGIA